MSPDKNVKPSMLVKYSRRLRLAEPLQEPPEKNKIFPTLIYFSLIVKFTVPCSLSSFFRQIWEVLL